MSYRTRGRIIGALFLAAFVFYGVGSLLVESVAGDDHVRVAVDEHSTRLVSGAAMMLINSAIVIAIGVLAHDVLRRRWPTVALVYLIARVFEGGMLAVGVVFVLLLAPDTQLAAGVNEALVNMIYAGNDIAYQIAMIGLGIGSVLFCWALYQDRYVARPLALWGLVGYPIFMLGATLELFGIGVGVWVAIPGGLFEVALAVKLLIHGLPEPTVPRSAVQAVADLSGALA